MTDIFIQRLQTSFNSFQSLFDRRTNFPLQVPIFFKYYVEQVIKLMRMKKWEYDSTVVKYTTFLV